MIKIVEPKEIEQKSMQIIDSELGEVNLSGEELLVLKRVIHTSADFDYKDNLVFSKNSVQTAIRMIQEGATIVTDTNMACSGVNKQALARLGCNVRCFMADEDVADCAKKNNTTRATASMSKAAQLQGPLIFAIGNAPTALIELDRLIKEENFRPALIIAVPVGFVNVVESKELILNSAVPHIVAKGRKGGSNVAAAICNALLYQAGGRDEETNTIK